MNMLKDNYIVVPKIKREKPKNNKKYTLMIMNSHGKIHSFNISFVAFKSYLVLSVIVFVVLISMIFHYQYTVSKFQYSVHEAEIYKNENIKLTEQVKNLNQKSEKMQSDLKKLNQIANVNKKMDGK